MMLCRISDCDRYLGSQLARDIVACVAQPPSEGRHTLRPGLDVIRMSYDTRERSTCYLETHRINADVQILLAGQEQMGVSLLAALQVHTAYDPARDAAFWQHEGLTLCNTWNMRPGLAAIFPPGCAHLTQMQVTGPVAVDKLVFKVDQAIWPLAN